MPKVTDYANDPQVAQKLDVIKERADKVTPQGYNPVGVTIEQLDTMLDLEKQMKEHALPKNHDDDNEII